MNERRLSGFGRRVAVVAAAVLLAFGALAVHFSVAGRQAMRRSDAAFDRGDAWSSLSHARSATSYYWPGAAHVEAGYARLRAIAFGAELEGQELLARRAWAALRGATLEVAHPRFVSEPLATEADEQLARLLARAGDPEKSRAFSEDELHRGLSGTHPRIALGFASSAVLVAAWAGLFLWARRRSVVRG